MTTTAHLHLTDLVLQALLAAPRLTDGPIARGRAIVLARQQQSAIGVRLVRSAGQRLSFDGGVQWQTAVVVECAARAQTGQQDAQSAVDPLLQATYARVAAIQLPPSTGSLAGDPDIHWETDDADPAVGLVSIVMRIDHITGPGALASAT